jgi:valyl-tRNA synthetase
MWNAVRFSLPHVQARSSAGPPQHGLTTADRWILSRSSAVAGEVSRALDAYRFDEAAAAIYHFAWHEVCDWYLEISKIRLSSGRDDLAEPARATLAHVLDRLLRMLHPFMPFLTEELWQALPRAASNASVASLAVAAFPVPEPQYDDPAATRAIGMLMEVVTLRRNLQAGLRGMTGPAETLVAPLTPEAREALEGLREELRALTRSSAVRIVPSLDGNLTAIRGVTPDAEVALPLAGFDVDAERQRLRGEIERAAGELAGHEAKLANDSFLARAKPDAVDKVKRTHRELTDRIAKLRATLGQLGS